MIKRSKRTDRRRKLRLKETIGEIHAANAHIPPDEIEKIVDDAVRAVRAERCRPRGSPTGKGRRK
jgi:hypothetical protein